MTISITVVITIMTMMMMMMKTNVGTICKPWLLYSPFFLFP
jgi:hypothetical protein